MIKRTLYFGNPAYLSLKLGQLVVKIPDSQDNMETVRTIPIEDVGIVILDHKQITLTQGLIEKLLDNNCALITCSSNHLPVGLMLPLYGNTIQNERFRYQIDASLPLRKQLWQQTIYQIDASLPLRKQLWQQTIQAKIANQAAVLKYATGSVHNNMQVWAADVRSGDSANMEARAAAYYWKTLFQDIDGFVRGRDEDEPNNLLNYGYAIVRAIIARALVSSGLLPTLGIHHHNRYNAYCLADDIMEPYRPYVDKTVFDICRRDGSLKLTTDLKRELLSIPTMDVCINDKRSPLMVAATTTTASLVKCFTGEIRRISYPLMT